LGGGGGNGDWRKGERKLDRATKEDWREGRRNRKKGSGRDAI